MTNFIVRPLASQTEVDQARNLLFNVYYRELGWRPAVDNASGLGLEIGSEGVMLVDDFDDEALWFGCFIDGRLVGCNRLLNGRLKGYEVERYTQIPAEVKQDGSYELNRLAIHKDFRTHSPVFILLITEQLNYLAAQGSTFIFSTAPVTGVGALYLRTGMKLHEMAPFRYETKDPDEVSFMYYDFKDASTLVRLRELCRRSTRGTQKRA